MEKGKFTEKAQGFVSDKQKKRRQSISSKVDSSDVQSASTGIQHHRTKTGPIRKETPTSGRRRKPIPELTLADHDASQTTLEDYYSVQYPQTTPVSTNPPHKMTPNRRKRIRRCLFPPDTCTHEEENVDSKILKQTTTTVSASSACRQPLHDQVRSSSGTILGEGTASGKVLGSAPSSSTSPLDSKPEEHQLLKVCPMVLENWKAVCTHLCIPKWKISESEQNNVGDVSQAFFNALLWWREGNCRDQCRPPTWRVLLGSIREAGFPDIAETIQKNATLGVL